MKEKLKVFLKYKFLNYCILALIVSAFTEIISRRSVIKCVSFVVLHPLYFILNALIIIWSYSFVLLTRRRKFAAVFISGLWIFVGFIDCVLRFYRVTPFNASDFLLIRSAFSVAAVYMAWWQIVLIGIVITGFIAGIIILWIKMPKTENKPKLYIALAVIIGGFFAVRGLFDLVIDFEIIPERFGNLTEAYEEYGIVYCFSDSLINVGISKPEDYSEETVMEIVNEEIIPQETLSEDMLIEEAADDNAQTSNEIIIKAGKDTPNIIFLQLESFFDVDYIKDIKFSEEPLPTFKALKDRYTSGFLSVPSVGAGTANTEFEVITGMNLDFFGSGEYPYNTVLKSTACESMAFDMKLIGYHASAIHNNSGSFYGRNQVFSQLGFDTFTPIEYMDGYDLTYMGWAKDDVLTEEIIKAINSTESADYIYTISVQGHGAYPEEDVLGDEKLIRVEGIEDEKQKNSIEYYVNQIHEMDKFISRLIDNLEYCDEDTILVLYGDHLPDLGLTEENLKNEDMFKTEYVIWNNFGMLERDKDIEAYQLSAYVLNLLDIHIGTMMCYHQNFMNNNYEILLKEEDVEEYLSGMEILEYDILYGNQDVYEENEIFEASDLKFGSYDIIIDDVWFKDDFMYVLGSKYNEFSTIYIDGKPVDTEYISENVIYASELDLSEADSYEIKVVQTGNDNTEFGESDIYVLETVQKE